MLDQQTQDELKQKLLAEKKNLEEELAKIARKEENGDYEAKHTDIGRDEESNADEVEEYTSNLGITETLENKLKEVDDALNRMEKGNYGKCENCPGEEIPVERLRAYPAAKTCIKCKSGN